MEKITQCGDSGAETQLRSIAQAFIESLRTISAERGAEVAQLEAERDSYRELVLAAFAELGAMSTKLDRERASRLWLLSQYRALQSGRPAGDPRLASDDGAILPEAAAA